MPRLARAAAVIDAYAAAHFRDYYADVAVAAGQTGLDFYRRAGAAALDTQARRLAAGVPIIVHDVRYSRTQLDELAAQITADVDDWHNHGITILGPTAAPDGSGVVVEVTDPGRARAALRQRYGAALRVVRMGTPDARPAPAPIGTLSRCPSNPNEYC